MKSIATFLFFFGLVSHSFSQTTTFATNLADSLADHSVKLATESVYIRTNKEVFERGEDLWFSATVLDRKTLVPSSSTQTLYVELRSENDQSMLKEMYSLENGFAAGHLFLSDTLEPGTYWLIAFTDLSTSVEQPMKSVRKMLIKDRIVPHVFIKTTFMKESFADDEPVAGKIELTSADGIEIEGLKTIVEFRSGDEVLDKIRGKSDDNGVLSFISKKTDFPSNTSLLVRVGHEDHEELHSASVPLKKAENFQISFMPEGGKIISGISNYVAFKSISSDGKPFAIKEAILLADDEEIATLRTDHAGMGRFSFFADGSKNYQVKVLDPEEHVFELPEFVEEGVQLHMRSKDQEKLTFSVLTTKRSQSDSVHLAVKRRGTVVWVASALLDENGLLLEVPVGDLPPGIVEITLYDSKGITLAERLVYLHLERQLSLQVVSNQTQYGTKETVNLKLKITDNNGKPVQSRFTLAAVDEIYASPFVKKNVASHFLLSDELEGSLFEPTYYFNKDNPRADEHLDLLMLTQGWRSYEWNFGQLVNLKEVERPDQIGTVRGQIEWKSLSAAARKKGGLEVQLFGEFGVMLVTTDSLGSFQIPSEALMVSKGSVIGVKVVENKNAVINFSSSFDRGASARNIDNLTYDFKRTMKRTKNWDESFGANDDVIELDEVQITANKVTYDTFWGQPLGIHVAKSSDYVCQYNILNCVNHRNGTTPVAGRVYLNQSGLTVTYKAAENDDQSGISFVKGHYQIPLFYQPNYEQNPDERLIPDFRNTLIWEPNLVTDENGEVEVSFFTSDIRSLFTVTIEGLGANGEFGVHSFDLKVLD